LSSCPVLTLNETSKTLAEVSELSKNRQAFYMLLSRILEKEVTNDLLAALRDKKSFFSQSIEGIDDKKMTEGFRLVNHYFENSSKKSLDEICLDLAVEYAGLFLGVWGKPPHPSESIYGSTGGALMQKERDDVLKMYRSVGLDRSKDFREPEDHVAIELQFMAILASKTVSASQAGDVREVRRIIDLQESFLRSHLGRWIGFLSHDVVEEGKLDFYKGICLLAEGFIEQDLQILSELEVDLKSKH
jgi:TorA maturation chaperone TorD